MKKYRFLLCALLSGSIFGLAWLPFLPGYLVFFGFFPLFFLEQKIFQQKPAKSSGTVFLYAYIAFGLWNFISFWWAHHASWFGAIAPVVINGFFMAVVFWLFHIAKRKGGYTFGYAAFIVFWLAFEYVHHRWEMSFPWLTLGNAFGKNIRLIQWYEYTGVLGGSLWVLLAVVLAFVLIKEFAKNGLLRKKTGYSIILFLWLTSPVVTSFAIFHSYKEKSNQRHIVVIQPNIDPYQRFSRSEAQKKLQDLLQLADSLGNDRTDYFVAPEEALQYGLWESNLASSTFIAKTREFLRTKYPHAKFVLGITSYKRYNTDEITSTAREMKKAGYFYDAFNTAIQIDTSAAIPVYHKSQLVIGVERMPFYKLLKPLKNVIHSLGGIYGSLGYDKERKVFKSLNDTVGIAPVICWESVFGEFVSDYVNHGADYIFVITNDGWWSDTPGYKVHLTFSQIRAVETRRSIARAANTGISCFINQKGELIKPTAFWKETAIDYRINANAEITYYTKHGDYIGRIAAFFAVLMLLYIFVIRLIADKKTLILKK